VLGGALAFLVLLAGGCAWAEVETEGRDWAANLLAFDREMQQRQADLAIPGLAYVIVEQGAVLAMRASGREQGSSRPFSTSTPLRLASVTKAFAAIVAMQLVEEGRLDLDAPVTYYSPTLAVPADVRVRHLLTHTSEGIVGREYVYGTTRYAMLGQLVADVSGQDFDQVLRQRVLDPAGMTAYPSPWLGAHTGLVSTTEDMGAFLVALDDGRLLSPASLERLASPSRSTTGAELPIGLGWFTQSIQGQRVVWSFGQDDPDHAGTLLIRLPERGLSLFVLANANTLSDPFRLLMGDVAKSPFAMGFLRLFVHSRPGAPLAGPDFDQAALAQRLEDIESQTPYRYREELTGRALVDLWRGRAGHAQQKLDLAAARYGVSETPDAVLHFAALRLPEPRSKDAAIEVGRQLLDLYPNNRWVLLAQGYLLQQRDRDAESSACFQRILDLPNQEPDFLWRLFRVWSWTALAQLTLEEDPAQARSHLQAILDSGIEGEALDEATRMLRSLDDGVPHQ